MISSQESQHRSLMALCVGKGAASDFSGTDRAVLVAQHRFIRDDEIDKKCWGQDWGLRMARRYYDKLYKEFALVDLSHYKENKIGLRWRKRDEVIDGKGQFTCGNLHCEEKVNITTYEVPFKYKEEDIIKHELVKVRVCEDCAKKLFYEKLKTLKRDHKRLLREQGNEDNIPDEGSFKRIKDDESLSQTISDQNQIPITEKYDEMSVADYNKIATAKWSNPIKSEPSEEDTMDEYFKSLLF